MKTLIIFTTMYGNTEALARAMGDALKRKGTVEVVPIVDTTAEKLAAADLVLVGSPTQAFNMLPAMKNWLKSLPKESLACKHVAAFDTRMDVKKVNNGFLTFMESIFGYAAEKIGKALIHKGGSQVAKPEGFFVDGEKGPISTGELERAVKWVAGLV